MSSLFAKRIESHATPSLYSCVHLPAQTCSLSLAVALLRFDNQLTSRPQRWRQVTTGLALTRHRRRRQSTQPSSTWRRPGQAWGRALVRVQPRGAISTCSSLMRRSLDLADWAATISTTLAVQHGLAMRCRRRGTAVSRLLARARLCLTACSRPRATSSSLQSSRLATPRAGTRPLRRRTSRPRMRRRRRALRPAATALTPSERHVRAADHRGSAQALHKTAPGAQVSVRHRHRRTGRALPVDLRPRIKLPPAARTQPQAT